MTKGTKKSNALQTLWSQYRDKEEKLSSFLNTANELVEYFKNLYLKAMCDLDLAGIITFQDRELIQWAVGEGKPFASFTALGEYFRFTPAEISNIRSGVRKMKSARIRIMLNKLEEIKRNE